jgi:hypothetical protein
MAEQPKCRSCGRLIRAVVSIQELRTGKQILCRQCNREPFTVEFAVRSLIRRYGAKPDEF